MPGYVSFTSDFGGRDSYVAEVKAVLLRAKPSAIVDVTHQVTPYNIKEGAFQLFRAYRHFPKQTIHLAVVDPGVGSQRRAIYVRTRDYHFVGPDNGLLAWAVKDAEKREKKSARVFEIKAAPDIMSTFHGRDLFAPFVVGLLSKTKSKLTSLDGLIGTSFPQGENGEGEVVVIDHFGNCVTGIPVGEGEVWLAHLNGQTISYAASYSEISSGGLALIKGSHGFWEIAARESSAALRLSVVVGQRVSVRPLRKV